ncbi:MAG: FkbM family methyltransferase [Cyanobacteriota bacterium]|nr:FkbM family methyltransferase [Cyanobacteriota bacterium]
MTESIDGLFNKALKHQNNGELEEAEALYLSILKINSNHMNSLVNLGVLYKARGDIETAIGLYKLGLSIEPNDLITISNLCRNLRQIDRLDEALYYGKKALTIKPDFTDIALNVGNILIQQGKLEEALHYFSQQLQKYPNNADIQGSIGNVLVRQNKLVEGKSELEKALKLNPKDLNTRRWLAVVNLLLQGKTKIKFVYRDIPIKFEISGKNIGPALSHVTGNFYELKELETIDKHIRAKDVIVDVGSNAGNHLVYFAKILKAGKIIPIEFHPETIELLKRHIALNEIENADLSKLGCAVGKERGEFMLVEHPANDLCLTEVFVSDRHNNSYQDLGDKNTKIEIIPLDELIDEKVDFLKIDVEGLEMDVLQGARNLFGKFRPDAMVEVKKANQKSFFNLLEKMGYRVVEEVKYWSYSNFYIQPVE